MADVNLVGLGNERTMIAFKHYSKPTLQRPKSNCNALPWIRDLGRKKLMRFGQKFRSFSGFASILSSADKQTFTPIE